MATPLSFPALNGESDFVTIGKSTLNLIVESKSLPVKLNNSTIELHLPVGAKEKRAITLSCGF